MPRITADRAVYTVLVELTVTPGNQAALLDVMTELEPILHRQIGLVSSSVHRSHDGTRVVDYLQWENKAAHDAWRNSTEMHEAAAELMGLIETGTVGMEMHSYEVVSVHEYG